MDMTMFFARESGGVKRYLTQKRAWLQAHRILHHTLLVPGGRDGAPREPGLLSIPSPLIPFAHGYRLPLNLLAWERALLDLQPDLIEVGDPYQLAWLGLRAGRKLGVPVVSFYHSDLPRLVGSRFGAMTGRLASSYVRQLYERFDLVLAPSQVMVNKLQALGIQQARFQPLGVDTERFRPGIGDMQLRERLGLPRQVRLLIYVGRFSREKNLPLLFKAMRQLGAPYHLLLVGAGMHLPRQDNVTLWPYQSETSDLARLIASCDAMVHPGDQETFGLVVLEAMACGKPVVGMAAGGVAELVDPGCGILVKPGSPAAFAEGVSALFDQDLQALGKNARSRVEQRFSWDRVIPRLLRQYASIPALAGQLDLSRFPIKYAAD
ncbi:glycosyltransferase family 1 protein [Thermithiobacillus plumbiphilus]|uniref:Glycosyltransferase family 1 protein n=1 Tax=Thermithiobacillus plumbiphilus TaxID=1729899 RepID=A0ABU9D8Z1_9PROT